MRREIHKTEKPAKIFSLIEFILAILCLVLFFVFFNNFKEDGYRYMSYHYSDKGRSEFSNAEYGSLVWAVIFLCNYSVLFFKSIERYERFQWAMFVPLVSNIIIFIACMSSISAKIFWLEIPFILIEWLFGSIVGIICTTFAYEDGAYCMEKGDYAKTILLSILCFLLPMIGFLGNWLLIFIGIYILFVIITKREPISALIIIIF